MSAAEMREAVARVFEFDRYVNGQLMAEGVTIEREPTLERAMKSAARLAAIGPKGEVPVLVLRAPIPDDGGVAERVGECEDVFNAAQAYRHCSMNNQQEVIAAYRAMIRAALRAINGDNS